MQVKSTTFAQFPFIDEKVSPETATHTDNPPIPNSKGEKFKIYRSIPTFQEYWLVDQYQIQIEQYYKTDEHTWLYRVYEDPQAILISPVLNVETTIQDIYEDVIFS